MRDGALGDAPEILWRIHVPDDMIGLHPDRKYLVRMSLDNASATDVAGNIQNHLAIRLIQYHRITSSGAKEWNDDALAGIFCAGECVNQQIYFCGLKQRLIGEVNHYPIRVRRNNLDPGAHGRGQSLAIVRVFNKSNPLSCEPSSDGLGFMAEDNDDLINLGREQRVDRVLDQGFSVEMHEELIPAHPRGHSSSGNTGR